MVKSIYTRRVNDVKFEGKSVNDVFLRYREFRTLVSLNANSAMLCKGL